MIITSFFPSTCCSIFSDAHTLIMYSGVKKILCRILKEIIRSNSLFLKRVE